MANPARGWRVISPAALVVIGWLSFAAALGIETPAVKALFLVAARALPHVLGLRRPLARVS